MSTRAPAEIQLQSNPDAYSWQPLRILSVYRLFVACSLLLVFLLTQSDTSVSSRQPALFLGATLFYIAFSGVALALSYYRRALFALQVYLQISVDILTLAILIYASGSNDNGLGILMVVAIAGGSILLRARMAALFAAIATVLLLGQQVLLSLEGHVPVNGFTQTGFLGLTIFATAIAGSLLARRARENQALADRRGVDLANLEALSRHIVQRLADGVLVLDSEDRVRLINEAAQDLLGRPTSEEERPRLESLSSELVAAVRDLRATPGPGRETTTALSRDGGEVRVRLRAVGRGRNRGTLVFLEDLGELRTRVQQAKLASLGRLSASIAHEIRNPLSAMLHAAQLLEESPALEGADLRLVEIVRKQGKRLNDVVESILQLSRRRQANRVTIDLGNWVAEFVTEAVPHQGLSAEQFRIEIPNGKVPVTFDRGHLYQIVGNLIRNSVEHGKRTLSELRILISVGRGTDNTAYLDIGDNGTGITEDAVGSLFEPFFTTSANGTGLGLYLCRELCETNGATLTLGATSSEGTRFRIRFAHTEMDDQ